MDTKTTLAEWGKVVVSILALVLFAGCLVVAYAKNDATSIALLVGAVVANATTAVNYWLGSSSGSDRKSDTIASTMAANNNAPPPIAKSGSMP